MKRLPAVSRADLLRLRDEDGGLSPEQAGFYGFVGQEVKVAVKQEEPVQVAPESEPDRRPEPSARIGFPKELPRLKFLMCEEAETLQHDTTPLPPGNPITDAELAVPWGKPQVPIEPLVRWARLVPWLRRRLGRLEAGSRLHLRRLMRQVGTGLPVCTLPYLPRRAWAPQAVLLCDETPEMAPFRKDLDFVVRQLRRERGRQGLIRRRIRGLAHVARFCPPPGVPVLALSSMGQYGDSAVFREAWIKLGQFLAFRGHSLQALCPVPRSRWRPELASAWPTVQWDHRTRLPRYGSQSVGLGTQRAGESAEALLDLLSPVARIEAPLLRATRLLLGRKADVGGEFDAWNHPDVDPSAECCCPRNEANEVRLQRRREWAERQPDLVGKVDRLIQEHLQSCSSVLLTETFLRTLREREQVCGFLQRCIDRLREEAVLQQAGCGSGLADWFPRLVDGLPLEVRRHEEVAGLIAQGLALADTMRRLPRTSVPVGVDREAYVAERRTAGKAFSRPVVLRVDLRRGSLCLQPAREVGVAGETEREKTQPLSFLAAGLPTVHLHRADGRLDSFEMTSPPGRLSLGGLSLPERIAVESDRQRLHFGPVERPAWARRMAYDRFGVFADFEIEGVEFVMRWIPPGRFLMGSPTDEPGRGDDEGPQHEVTISRGFWLAETPVTQGQWKAVVARGESELEREPSHFKGPSELPVENLDWFMARRYCLALTKLLEDSLAPDFCWHLPSEAQWEYACRAGTNTALYTGGIEIKGIHNAPALDPISWYSGNSGIDLEVSNPMNSGWSDQQYDHKKAGTHRVKGKKANRFGLYDMIGNVWEWCLDGVRNYKDQAEVDPLGEADENAGRVARGGAWNDGAQYGRSACRLAAVPGDRWGDLGLRLAAGQPPEAGSGSGAAEPPGAERLKG